MYLKESKIELQDDTVGIFDTPTMVNILEWVRGSKLVKNGASDPLNVDHQPMIRYWNFVLNQEQNIYARDRYNFLAIVEEAGGVMGFITALLFYMLRPMYYKRNELEVLLELEKMKNSSKKDQSEVLSAEKLPDYISFKLLFLDIKEFLRGIKLWPKRDENPEKKDLVYEINVKMDEAITKYFSLEKIL